jgi:hypothetical protein
MYSSALHRVNIIAGPEPERDATHAQADTPEMRRLAALFNAHRDALCTADDQEAAQDSALDDTTTAAAQEQAEAQQQLPEQPQPEHPAVAAGAAALLRAESAAADADASANASTGTSTTASTADAATQRDAGFADLPFAPAWQKPDQGSGNGDASGGNPGGQNSGNNASHPNPAPAQAARSGGNAPTPAARSGGSVPAPAAAPANLIAALRAATTAPGFTASRTAQPPAVSATTPPASQPGQAGQAAHPAQPRHARVDAAPAALGIAALNPNAQQTPLIESIVSSVADFCANPAVFSSSPWQLTVPLDPALLPGTQLTLVLSHFALTLRFATTEPASHDLILQHADALRQDLEALPTLHQDTPRAIEIVVT